MRRIRSVPGQRRAVCAGVMLAGLLLSCSLEAKRPGESCRRSTECEPGLACVRDRCSRDLGPIARESTVPRVANGAAGAAADAGLPVADGG